VKTVKGMRGIYEVTTVKELDDVKTVKDVSGKRHSGCEGQ
jgi:hypothetical protein